MNEDKNYPWNNEDNQEYPWNDNNQFYENNTEYSSTSTYKEPSTGNLLTRLFLSYVREMPVTYILIAANIIAFIMSSLSSTDSFHTGGVNYDYVVINGEYIRFLSHLFLHANLLHIANNMVMLWIFGSKLEPYIGSLKMTIVYFGSGFSGGLLSMYMHHKLDPVVMTYSAGASGAIYGVMLATFIAQFMLKNSKKRDDTIKAIAYIGIFIVLSIKNSDGVDSWSHLGGAVAGGIIMAILLTKRDNLQEAGFLKMCGTFITVTLCVIGILGADIGNEAKELPDERVDFVKEQYVPDSKTVTFGDVFSYGFSEKKWKGFETEEGYQVVEFIGKTYYKGEEREFRFQFIVSNNNTKYEISYFGIDGEPSTYKGYKDFMKYIRDRYEKSI